MIRDGRVSCGQQGGCNQGIGLWEFAQTNQTREQVTGGPFLCSSRAVGSVKPRDFTAKSRRYTRDRQLSKFGFLWARGLD